MVDSLTDSLAKKQQSQGLEYVEEAHGVSDRAYKTAVHIEVNRISARHHAQGAP